MALKTALERIAKARKAYNDEVKKLGRKGVSQGLGELIPEGYVLAWTQGTPSFNDGDPCTFSMHSIKLVPAKAPPEPEPDTTGVDPGPEGETVEDDVSDDDEPIEYNVLDAYEEDGDGVVDIEYPCDKEDLPEGLTKKAITELARAWKGIGEDTIKDVFTDGDAFIYITAKGKSVVDNSYEVGY